MELAFRIPMLLRGARPVHYNVPSEVLYLTERLVSYEVPEADPAKHPVAFGLGHAKNTEFYRVDDDTGVLYRRTVSVDHVSRSATGETSRSRSPMRYLYEDIVDHHRELRKNGATVMPLDAMPRSAVCQEHIWSHADIIHNVHTMEDVASWTAVGEQYIAGAVVMEGHVWLPAREPLIEARRLQAGGWRVKPITTVSRPFDTGTVLFSIGDIDELASFQGGSGVAAGREFGLSVGVYTSTYDAGLMNVALLAAAVVASVETQLAPKGGHYPVTLAQMPTAFILGYAHLRVFLDMDAADRSEDDTEEAMQTIITMSGMATSPFMRRIMPPARDVELHRERWYSRSIQLDDMEFGALSQSA